MLGNGESPSGGCGVSAPIIEISCQAALADVRIDAGDRSAETHESRDQVHGGRRLAAATLFVADDDKVSALENGHA
jgi:hypothetical protein